MSEFNSDILLINQNALDQELIQQAQTYFEIAEAYAEAASKRDSASEAIKTCDADLYFLLRQQYESGGTKVTESLLTQKVLSHPEHMKAHTFYNHSKLEADRLAALKDAFGQRAYMLRDLVQLYTTGYFTETSVTGKEGVASDIAYLHNRRAIKIEKGNSTEETSLDKRRKLRAQSQEVNT
jgi:hypothetical protein